jgi:two-component system, cell cycle response regulator
MRISPGAARRASTVAVVTLTGAATIALGAVVGGGPWLVALVVGALLGGLGTLTAIGISGSARGALAPAREAMIDPVTGLPNTERLLTDLETALHFPGDDPALHATRDDRALTLYLFVLHGFKDYNDAYADACGDALLAWLARKLREAVGDHATAYRMRGGSFALLAGGSERSTASLRDASATALHESGDGFHISCTVGQAALPAEAQAPQAALELAARRAHAQANERQPMSGLRARADPIEALRLVPPRYDVAPLATRVGRRMNLPAGDLEHVQTAVHLCDVGNLAVPSAVLGHAGELPGHEWEFILLHTLVGERLLAASYDMEAVARLVRSSHERWDGGGYPDGLAAGAIPVGSRIVFVCSAFHDMTSDRAHQPARKPADALAELERGAVTQFDPEVVRVFCEEFGVVFEEALAG